MDNPTESPAAESPAADSKTFSEFGFSAAVMRGVEEAGFREPSPIQWEAIPAIMQGRDIIGQAHTGTGKTAAFGLPCLTRLDGSENTVRMLVVTPTRELANQVSDEIYRLGQFIPVRTAAVYGGQPYPRQIDSIRRGAQVVVATPGRLLDLLEGGRLKDYFKPSVVVLDEADEMLDMGFLDDVRKIFSFLPAERQTLLFSATMPKPIQLLADEFLKDPIHIKVNRTEATSSDIEQFFYVIDEQERDDATTRLIDSMEPGRAIVFCRTKREVDRMASTFASQGILAQPLHGDMEQPMRERVITGFRNGDFQVLVATDVAARGLDVPEVTHVFNYHIPFDTDSYVHRIGRTGRAGRKGVAVTLVTPREYHGLRRIESKVGRLQHRLIPTHADIKNANEKKLFDSLRSQSAVEQETERFLVALEEEFGLAGAAHRLAALLLSKEAVTGPDRIGVQGSRLSRLRGEDKPADRGGQQRGGQRPFVKDRGFRGGKGRPQPGGFARRDAESESRQGAKPGKFADREAPRKFGDRKKPDFDRRQSEGPRDWSSAKPKASYKPKASFGTEKAPFGKPKASFGPGKAPFDKAKPSFDRAKPSFGKPKPSFSKRGDFDDSAPRTFDRKKDQFGKPEKRERSAKPSFDAPRGGSKFAPRDPEKPYAKAKPSGFAKKRPGDKNRSADSERPAPGKKPFYSGFVAPKKKVHKDKG